MLGKIKVASVALSALALGACLQTQPEPETSESDIPELTMDLPVTLSGVIATSSSKVRARATIDDCSQYLDQTANPNANGYELSRFLIGLSQSQSCVADWIMQTVVGTAAILANKGIQEIPVVSTVGEDPSHFEVVKVNDTFHVWLYFGQPNTSLNYDTVKTMYITWTKTADSDDVSGQFFFVRLGNDAGTDQPGNLRVDFTRSATLNQNDIFLDFADPATTGQNGFRIQVTENIGSETTYTAKGLLEFAGQPADNLPTSETYDTPTLDVVAVADEAGAGAAIWHINDLNWHIGNGSTLNVGTYGIQLEDESFFSQTGSIEWQYRQFSDGRYINTSEENTRVGANGILTCLESADTTQDCLIGTNALNLGDPYFEQVCTDSDNADCTLFMSGYYDQGAMDAIFGAVTNSTDAKPDDWRATSFTGLVPLDSLYSGTDTADTVFVIPNESSSI